MGAGARTKQAVLGVLPGVCIKPLSICSDPWLTADRAYIHTAP